MHNPEENRVIHALRCCQPLGFMYIFPYKLNKSDWIWKAGVRPGHLSLPAPVLSQSWARKYRAVLDTGHKISSVDIQCRYYVDTHNERDAAASYWSGPATAPGGWRPPVHTMRDFTILTIHSILYSLQLSTFYIIFTLFSKLLAGTLVITLPRYNHLQSRQNYQ